MITGVGRASRVFVAIVVGLIAVLCCGACSNETSETDQVSSLFQRPATEFDDDLAVIAGELSQAANSESDDGIQEMLTTLGLQHCKSVNYGSHDALGAFEKSGALTIAEMRLEGSGQDSRLIVIVTRGTISKPEAIGDVFKGGEKDFLGVKIWNNVYEYEETVFEELGKYAKAYGIGDSSEPLVFLVCGHSLGGACASAFGARLTHGAVESGSEWWSGRTSRDKVYVYTFGGIKVVANDKNVSDGYENIHNIYNEYDSYGPNGNWKEQNVSLPDAKFGHTELFSFDAGEQGWLIWDRSSNNHDIGLYIGAVRDHRDNDSGKYGLSTCSDEGEAVPMLGARDVQEASRQPQPDLDRGDSNGESNPNEAFTIVGSWRSVGPVGFGQAQPGATVTFTEDQCNFYSPSDTYRLYESEGALKLDCTNVLWKDTLTFTVEVADDDHITIDTGSTKTTTVLERISGDSVAVTDGVATHIDGMYANFDLPLVLVYDFYEDGVMYACWADEDGKFLSKAEGSYDIHDGVMTMYVDLDAAAEEANLDPGVSLGKMTGQSVTCEIDGDILYLDGEAFYRVE